MYTLKSIRFCDEAYLFTPGKSFSTSEVYSRMLFSLGRKILITLVAPLLFCPF
jgi:hypothetical protein